MSHLQMKDAAHDLFFTVSGFRAWFLRILLTLLMFLTGTSPATMLCLKSCKRFSRASGLLMKAWQHRQEASLTFPRLVSSTSGATPANKCRRQETTTCTASGGLLRAFVSCRDAFDISPTALSETSTNSVTGLLAYSRHDASAEACPMMWYL